jgi:hypothetical protein
LIVKRLRRRTATLDLLWQATPSQDLLAHPTVEPGVIWWAFDARSASRISKRTMVPEIASTHERGIVLLLERIDLVHPDVSEELLEVFKQCSFVVDPLETVVHGPSNGALLVVLTSEGEVKLSDEAVRACVRLNLAAPSMEMLFAAATTRFPQVEVTLIRHIIKMLVSVASDRESYVGFTEVFEAIEIASAVGLTPAEIDQRIRELILDKTREVDQ